MTLGCAGELDKPSSEQGDVSEFTTKGKPIKIIETPWGAREVYDPSLDTKVVNLIKTQGLIKSRSDFFDNQILEQATYEQLDSLYAAGCVTTVNAFCDSCTFRVVTRRNKKLQRISEPVAICNRLDTVVVDSQYGCIVNNEHMPSISSINESIISALTDEDIGPYFNKVCLKWRE